jgi:restriction endonuclease S subunit
MNNFEWIEFENLFTLEKGELQSSKIEEDEDGKYPVISKCQNHNDWKYTNDFKIDGENIYLFLTSNTTKLGITYYNGKCITTDLVSRLIINNDLKIKINIKYMYYVLKSLKNHIEEIYFKGSCHQSLDKKNFNRMKIPIPPIEIQNRITEKIDSSSEKVKYMKLIVESMKHDITNFFEMTISIENKKKETQWIEFGNLFTLEKGKLQSSKVEEDEEGKGIFINWSLYNNYKKINNFTQDGENLFISTSMPNGKKGSSYMVIKYYNGKCDYCDLMSRLIIDEKYKDIVNIKYVYYYLELIKDHIEKTYEKGSCNKSLDIKNFNRIKIQIPNIEQQNKCINSINEMEIIIEKWKKDIENILNNCSMKFIDFLQSESIKYEAKNENIFEKMNLLELLNNNE